MENQKIVNILGLSSNTRTGRLEAFEMEFDPKQKLYVVKGKTRAGKSTAQTLLKGGALGAKALPDKGLYGEIDTRTILVDGEHRLIVTNKTGEDGKLKTKMHIVDAGGKINRKPVIDGKTYKTASSYLDLINTKLTWRMPELVSKNATEQRNILLELYAPELAGLGVVLDKKSPKYKDSILGKIDEAKKERDYADAMRKQVGGIAEDLKDQGYDVDKPDNHPNFIEISAIETEIQKLHTEIAVANSNPENAKEKALEKIKSEVGALTHKCLVYNNEQIAARKVLEEQYDKEAAAYAACENLLNEFSELQEKAVAAGYLSERFNLGANWKHPVQPVEPEPAVLIELNESGIVTDTNTDKPYIADIIKGRDDYRTLRDTPLSLPDTSAISENITVLENQKAMASRSNKIVKAIEAFQVWRGHNATVTNLKGEYMRKLASVNTGVEGFVIVADDETNEIYGTYNGAYDPAYFGNRTCKVSALSGTESIMFTMLVQNYLLSRKDKALRCLFIDDVPIDKETRKLVEKMCNELGVQIFMNITGDFDKEKLQDGEVLIENGELFFA